VYLVHDVAAPSDLYVLKRAQIAADDDDSLAIARREVAVLRALPPHPNVVRCLGASEQVVGPGGRRGRGSSTLAPPAGAPATTSGHTSARRSSWAAVTEGLTSFAAGGRAALSDGDDTFGGAAGGRGAGGEGGGDGPAEGSWVVIDLLLEYCAHGTSLKEADDARRAGSPGLPESVLLARFRDLALGLAHMHSQSPPIVHRDVKPENLLLTDHASATTGGGVVGRLCDFGSCVYGLTPLEVSRPAARTSEAGG
jgi:serine/threonine protein kinase